MFKCLKISKIIFYMKITKNIIIIGSTGTVGQHAVKLVQNDLSSFNTLAVVAYSNYNGLASDAKKIQAKSAIIIDNEHYLKLKNILDVTNIQSHSGEQALFNMFANEKNLTVVIASSGTATIKYLYEALKYNHTIALANKESIVCGGEFMQEHIKKSSSKIIPIDSEHNALYQLIEPHNHENIHQLIITASGGPFVNLSLNELKNVRKEDALNHPTWNMGNKITIDSATMVNKALEFIETSYLFNMPYNKIDVLLHRQSIMHGAVSYIDGSFLANCYTPSMAVPVAFALYYPHRKPTTVAPLNLSEIGSLKFEAIDENRFKPIAWAKNVLKLGGTYPMIMNVANEIAVLSFLNNIISFVQIFDVIEYCLNKIQSKSIHSFENLIEEYEYINKIANNYIKGLS